MPDNPTNDIFTPLALPCGRVIQNRLVKAAMYEHLAALFGGPPNQYHFDLYSQWARHGWGMIITGNVQVSRRHLTLGRDIVLPHHISQESLEPFKQLALSIHGGLEKRNIAIMQLSHAGRQSPNILGGRFPFQPPLAPSGIRVGSKPGGHITAMLHWLLFQNPQPMSRADIDEVVDSFTKGATVASQSGFDGVELHAAHGYLLAQFISPKSNRRVDDYSSNSTHALHLLHHIVHSIRKATPEDFILGIKINAADYTDFDIEGKIAIEHIHSIASWGGVDFIEISGGDYEKPEFMENSASHSARRALFSRFSHQAVAALQPLRRSSTSPLPAILLTGGLRTPNLLCTALSAKHAHLLGIGRCAVTCPELPQLLDPQALSMEGRNTSLDIPFRPEPDLRVSSFWKWLPEIPLIGAGVGMAWYVLMIRRLALKTGKLDAADGEHSTRGYNMNATTVVLRMFLWFGSDSVFLLRSSYIPIAIAMLLAGVYSYVNL